MIRVGFDDLGEDLVPKHSHRRYTREYLDQLLSAADIVSVIEQHVDLRSVGKDEWKGLCPFHDDHRPSLGVNQTKGVFRCYACNVSGNVISFLRMMEGLTFPEAIRRLQQITGISPPSPLDAITNSFPIEDVDAIDDDIWTPEDLMWNIASTGGGAIKSHPSDPVVMEKMMAIFKVADDALTRDDRKTLKEIESRLRLFASMLSREASR